jgi:hypothetical protein
MMNRIEIDEDGRVHSHGGKKNPPIDLPWEIRAVVLGLIRVSILIAAAVQFRASFPTH